MQIDIKNVAMKSGMALLIAGTTLTCGITLLDTVIDHEEMICPVTIIENALGLDGNKHQEMEMAEDHYYKNSNDSILEDTFSVPDALRR